MVLDAIDISQPKSKYDCDDENGSDGEDSEGENEEGEKLVSQYLQGKESVKAKKMGQLTETRLSKFVIFDGVNKY